MAKKKAGPNKVNNIKTSNFLPNVFQTDINKSWLDSTLDQMVSKGPLGQVNGYIGSNNCLLYTSPSPRDLSTSRMPSSA